MNKKEIAQLEKLYHQHYGRQFETIEKLPETGSYRKYFRLKEGNHSVLGVINSDLKENSAYLSFSKTFTERGIHVPQILIVSDDNTGYLVEDLGKNTLYALAINNKEQNGLLNKKSLDAYKATLKELFKLQTNTIKHIDTKLCYPRDSFDFQSILWDLYYFKYYTLKLMRITFDEQALETDMLKMAKCLDKEDRNAFLYRDFQSRNILIKDDTPYFIDFQGGRKGAIYYDLASLLYDANVGLATEDINTLSVYYKKICVKNNIDTQKFDYQFKSFSAIRLMQALGAFGLRGVIEKKPGFIECIPFAIDSLHKIFERSDLKMEYKTIYQSISDLKTSPFVNKIINNDDL